MNLFKILNKVIKKINTMVMNTMVNDLKGGIVTQISKFVDKVKFNTVSSSGLNN